MSDGPHKSLGMRSGWKKFAKRCDFASYEADQRTEALCEALAGDWQAERCNEFIDEIRGVLNAGSQGNLFENVESRLEALKKISGAGYPLRRTLLDNVEQSIEQGLSVADAIFEGTKNTAVDWSLRGMRDVDEHYKLKSTDRRAAKVRGHIEECISQHSYDGLTRSLLKIDGGSSQRPRKRDSLDDGVRLP